MKLLITAFFSIIACIKYFLLFLCNLTKTQILIKVKKTTKQDVTNYFSRMIFTRFFANKVGISKMFVHKMLHVFPFTGQCLWQEY